MATGNTDYRFFGK